MEAKQYQKRIDEIKSLYTYWDVCEVTYNNHCKSNSLLYDSSTECCPDSDCHGDDSCGAAGIMRLSAQDFNCANACEEDVLHGMAGGAW